MNPKLYPKSILRECEWCGALAFKYTMRKQDARLLYFCSDEHRKIYAKHVRNKDEMMGLTCKKKGDRHSYKRRTLEELGCPLSLIWIDRSKPTKRIDDDEYKEALRKHKLNSNSGCQSVLPCKINERDPNWKEDSNAKG